VRVDRHPVDDENRRTHQLSAVRFSVTGRRPVRRHAPAELKHGLVPRAQLADVAGYAGPYRVAHTLGMND
jgi:hypothetical protein